MMSPFVSVVMSVYNGEKYLKPALESIFKQTYKNLEFIIINDGSTDRSLEIIQSYQRKDDRTILINRENRGLIISLNEGLDVASGKYIVRMDADDISVPTRIEEQVEFMEANTNIGVLGTDIEVFGEGIKSKRKRFHTTHNELLPMLLFTVTFAHPSVIMRKALLDRHQARYSSDYEHAEDYYLWLVLSEYTQFANVPRALLKYRNHDSNITVKADKDEPKRLKMLNAIYNNVLEKLDLGGLAEDSTLHYAISSGSRMEQKDIDLDLLNDHFKKIIEANSEKFCFSNYFLRKYLSKRLLLVVLVKLKKKEFKYLRGVRYQLFWMAIYYVIKDL